MKQRALLYRAVNLAYQMTCHKYSELKYASVLQLPLADVTIFGNVLILCRSASLSRAEFHRLR